MLTPATRQAILIWLLLCALTVLITYGDAGRDGMPIVEAGRLLQAGIQPFSEAGQDVIKARFDAPGRTRCDQCALVGLVYPGTAIVVALPLSLLPSPFGEYLLAFWGLVQWSLRSISIRSTSSMRSSISRFSVRH